MKALIHQSRINQLFEQRNGYLVLASASLLLCLLLVVLCFYLSNRERIVVVPPTIERSFWVSNSEVSADYLSQMTTFLAYLRLNVTPDNVNNQRQLLLRYTDPAFYGPFNDQLVADQDRIAAEHVSSAFYPVGVEVDAKKLIAVITGDLTSSVGTTQIPPQRVTYAMHYRYVNGRLWLTQFEEVKPHV